MIQNQPLVSVIMPAYNCERTVGAAISGVLMQEYPNVELVVVDDGSTDATSAICASHGTLIHHQRIDNSGSSHARNVAISMARGELIAFCDADDVLLPPYIGAAIQKYQAAGGGRRIVMNDAYQLTSNGIAHARLLIRNKFPSADRQRMAILQKNFVPILSLFPATMHHELRGFDEHLQLNEDWDYWLRAVMAGYEVLYQPVPHAMYRLTPGSKSTDSKVHTVEDQILRRAAEEYRSSLTDEESRFLDLRLRLPPPRRVDAQLGDALRAGDHAQARRHAATLATLSSEDSRLRLRALAIARVPGAARAFAWRQQRIDRRMGGRLTDHGSTATDSDS